jgi:hypothetical protein
MEGAMTRGTMDKVKSKWRHMGPVEKVVASKEAMRYATLALQDACMDGAVSVDALRASLLAIQATLTHLETEAAKQ